MPRANRQFDAISSVESEGRTAAVRPSTAWLLLTVALPTVPVVSSVLHGIHPNKNVGPGPVLFEEYGLKLGRRNEFRLRDALERMAGGAR